MRLCNRGKKPNTARMKRFLKVLGITGSAYMTWTGGQALNAFRAANPTWTGRAWEILVIENIDILKGGRSSQEAHDSAVSDRRYTKKRGAAPIQARTDGPGFRRVKREATEEETEA